MCPKRKGGFLKEAKELIQKEPGLTADEVVRKLLSSGRASSAAQNPVGSLTATIQKHYMDIGVNRRKVGSIYRFYANGMTVTEDLGSNNLPRQPLGTDEVEITLRLPIWIIGLADNQVNSGVASSRGQAISRLVEKGLNASL